MYSKSKSKITDTIERSDAYKNNTLGLNTINYNKTCVLDTIVWKATRLQAVYSKAIREFELIARVKQLIKK